MPDLPAIPADATPIDPDRTPVATDGFTHVILHNAVGPYCKGDRIGPKDLPTADAGLTRLVGLNAARPLRPEELPAATPTPTPAPTPPPAPTPEPAKAEPAKPAAPAPAPAK